MKWRLSAVEKSLTRSCTRGARVAHRQWPHRDGSAPHLHKRGSHLWREVTLTTEGAQGAPAGGGQTWPSGRALVALSLAASEVPAAVMYDLPPGTKRLGVMYRSLCAHAVLYSAIQARYHDSVLRIMPETGCLMHIAVSTHHSYCMIIPQSCFHAGAGATSTSKESYEYMQYMVPVVHYMYTCGDILHEDQCRLAGALVRHPSRSLMGVLLVAAPAVVIQLVVQDLTQKNIPREDWSLE